MKKSELFRITNILERDRIGVENKIYDILNRDIENVLNEYFNLEKPIKIQMKKEKGMIEIEVIARANSVKKCNILP